MRKTGNPDPGKTQVQNWSDINERLLEPGEHATVNGSDWKMQPFYSTTATSSVQTDTKNDTEANEVENCTFLLI